MEKTILKIKKLDPQAIIPKYAHAGDSGLDLFCLTLVSLEPSASYLIKTGLAIELPPGTEAQIRPRSGLALNHGITVLNTPGTIDAGYRGEIGVILINHGPRTFTLYPGTKIAQLVVCPVIRVEVQEALELNAFASERGAAGFGSTGY